MSLDKMNRGELIAYCIKAKAEIERLRTMLADLIANDGGEGSPYHAIKHYDARAAAVAYLSAQRNEETGE